MRLAVTFDAGGSCDLSDPGRYNLRTHPQAIEDIEAAQRYPALRSFLSHISDGESPFLTVGCKVWASREGSSGESCVFTSRVDITFQSQADNAVRSPLEDVANWLAELLERESDALSADLRIVPAKFSGEQEGYCLRLSLSARGATSGQAEMRWGLGMAHVQQAVLFVARSMRQ